MQQRKTIQSTISFLRPIQSGQDISNVQRTLPHINGDAPHTAVPGSRKRGLQNIRKGQDTRSGKSTFAPNSDTTQGVFSQGLQGAIPEFDDDSPVQISRGQHQSSQRGLLSAGANRSIPNQSFITMKSLKEAEVFDKDISQIMEMVSGIEKDFQFERMNDDFKQKKIAQNNSVISQAFNPLHYQSQMHPMSQRGQRRMRVGDSKIGALVNQSQERLDIHTGLLEHSQSQLTQRKDANRMSLDVRKARQHRIPLGLKTYNFVEYKGNTPISKHLKANNLFKKDAIQEQSELKDRDTANIDLNEEDIIRTVGNMSKQSFQAMSSVSSRAGYRTGTGGDTSRRQQKKIMMHVNKFVPFYMQYQVLPKEVITEFEKDYSQKNHTHIKEQLQSFDQKLIDIFNHRRDRYIKKYYPAYAKNDANLSVSMEGLLDEFDDFEEGQHDEEVSKKHAEDFQHQDVIALRKVYKDTLLGFNEQYENLESIFSKERDFFLKQCIKDQDIQNRLQSEITHIRQQFKDEKQYAYDIFIKAEVSKSISRAVAKYESVTDQMAFTKRAAHDQAMKIRSLDKKSFEDYKFKGMYQDLLNQFECEKKLNQQMLEVLENKVSDLIADNSALRLKNIQLQTDANEYLSDIEILKQQIQKLAKELEQSAQENHHLHQVLAKSDDSKISVYQYEQVKTDLDMAQSQNATLKTSLAISVADKDALYSHLVDVKNSLIFVMANVDKKFEHTVKSMNEKMLKLEDKIVRVQDVIKETVQFSNRTYFMEEVRILRADKSKAEKDVTVVYEKLKLARKRIGDLEAIVTEYAQRESGNMVANKYGIHGGDVTETDLQDVQDIQDVQDGIRLSKFSHQNE